MALYTGDFSFLPRRGGTGYIVKFRVMHDDNARAEFINLSKVILHEGKIIEYV